MNNELFNRAQALYEQRDYEGALDSFTRCLQDEAGLAPGETGLVYHKIGNCLVKLKKPGDAIHAYTQATADDSYDACGSVNHNLGMAYAALHDYEHAVRHFEIAVSDAKYDTPYKAYIGMGNALMKLGKSAEAGVAFREAALDEGNPDPTKALLNLGVCFMALGRPADAVSSYESALQFDMAPDTCHKLYANLGQAYVAIGQMQKAATAFEQAIADKTYFLSDSASVDYQRAVAAVAQGTAEITQVLPYVADTSGLDVTAGGTPVDSGQGSYGYADQDPYQDPYYYGDGYEQDYPGGYQEAEERFFTASDEELEQWSRGLAKQERKRKNVGLKILVVLIVIVLVAFGVGVFAYTQGFGYPSQETVVQQLFADPDAATDSVISQDVDAESAEAMVQLVQQDDSVDIDGIEKSMSESSVYVTADTSEGGQVSYKVSLVRDMIGWKVADVELYFASQN